MTKGGRNLVILGVCSVGIAVATTGVALAVYHYTGDIYLDRSRPGYLPDEEEIKEGATEEEEYQFLDSGAITKSDLDLYIKNLNSEYESIKSYKKPFDAASMSDESLGIPAE